MAFNGTVVKRWGLALAGAAACAYALAVLYRVQASPDIGLRCAFTNVVDQIFPGYVWEGEGGTGSNADRTIPQRGDAIVEIGDQRVSAWPQILRALDAIDGVSPKPLSAVPGVGEPGQTYIQVGGERLVYVRFERLSPGQAPLEFGRWFRVGHLPAEDLIPSTLWFCVKIGLFAVGALVFWKRPGDRAAAQFFLLCIVTVGAYMGGYHWSRIATHWPLLVVFMACGVVLPAVSLHFYLVFPRPKPFLETRPAAAFLGIYGPPAALLAGVLLSYLRLRWIVRGGGDDGAVEQAWSTLRAWVTGDLVVAALWYILSVLSLLYSYRHAADVTERNQVKWIFFGSVLALAPIGYTLYLVFWERSAFSAGKGTWPMFAASVCFTAAFAVSITRYRLLQLDQIISSGAIYVLVSALAALIYYAVVFGGMLVATLVGTQYIPGGPSLAQTVWVSTTVLILLLAVNLARGRFKKVLDRRFDRHKHQLDRTLKRMGHVIDQLVDPPTLARRLLQTSAELLNVHSGAVYLREGETGIYRLAGCLGPRPPALLDLPRGCPLVEALASHKSLSAWPEEDDDAARRQLRLLGGEVAFALSQEPELLAFLVLGPKESGFYGSDDLHILAAFAQLTAVALASAEGHGTIERLNRDLRAKIEKISEQQRRILVLQSQIGGATPARPEPTAAPAEPQPALAEAAPAGPFGSLVGAGSAMRAVLEMARKVAATPSAVLIHGESGTGKELLARALHEASPRAGRPFVAVHCAALSPGLLESELFGHVKGAFTGAHKDKVGRFELADGGTLFLDEIGDITLEVQTKLLRVLQEKTFEKVGSSEPTRVNVRVVAATHRDLEALVAAHRFRDDLYYRLNVISLRMPALRERREDVPELVLHFLRLYGQQTGKPVTQVEDDALALLKAHRWPGNIRELQNVVEHAVAMAEGPTLTLTDLPADLLRAAPEEPEPATGWAAETVATRAKGSFRAERERSARRERDMLVHALAAANGNKAEAARALGIARSTLLSRLRKYGLN